MTWFCFSEKIASGHPFHYLLIKIFLSLRTNGQKVSQKILLISFSTLFFILLCVSMYFQCSGGLFCKIHRKPEIHPVNLLKKWLRYRCFLVNLSKFSRKSTLQNTSGRLPSRFVCFTEILLKKAFWMVLWYFRNRRCKLSIQIVQLSQPLSAYCYLKMSKFPQCHRQPRAPRKDLSPQ